MIATLLFSHFAIADGLNKTLMTCKTAPQPGSGEKIQYQFELINGPIDFSTNRVLHVNFYKGHLRDVKAGGYWVEGIVYSQVHYTDTTQTVNGEALRNISASKDESNQFALTLHLSRPHATGTAQATLKAVEKGVAFTSAMTCSISK